jgi:uncharacterized protein YlxP (DUF503 family)
MGSAPVKAFVCIVELQLHFGESQDLKGKRKQLQSLKTLLRQRFGASVAEVDGQDTWQRSRVVCALVGGPDVEDRADALQRFAESRCPDGCAVRRDLRSLGDIRG